MVMLPHLYTTTRKRRQEIAEKKCNKRVRIVISLGDWNLDNLSTYRIIQLGKLFLYCFHLEQRVQSFFDLGQWEAFAQKVQRWGVNEWRATIQQSANEPGSGT